MMATGFIVVGLHAASAMANAPQAPQETPKPASLKIESWGSPDGDDGQTISVMGTDARRQVIVTGTLADGRLIDFTQKVSYDVSPKDVIRIDRSGLIRPQSNGTATLKAIEPSGVSATATVVVSQFDPHSRVSFPNQIVPVLTKYGCNSGACHGKAQGRNGFRLSLLGFEPSEDYDHLVREGRGRRVFPAAPDESLLLLKPTGTEPHEGGSLIDRHSFEYRLIRRWISQGLPPYLDEKLTISDLEVYPSLRTMHPGEQQQLIVIARYSDGSWADVTRMSLYEANAKEMAEVSKDGLVTVLGGVGNAAIMIRFQTQAEVFRAMIPLGAPVDHLPAPKNFIDELVFKQLKDLGLPPSAACNDSTFIRRTTLDIAGRVPTLEETDKFLADGHPDKRAAWIDTLLASTDYADFFANKWSGLLRNRRSNNTYMHGTYEFYSWIRDSLHHNVPYDQFVRAILTASGGISRNPPVAWYRQVRDANTQLEDAAQLFLGVRLKCARCHHHPFEKWSQKDYYGFAAFFSRVGRKTGAQPGEEIIFHNRGTAWATHPRTNEQVSPAGLGAEPLNLPADEDPRSRLAAWMVAKDNPFFAHMLVNRYWKHFFGRGLVEPEDDIRATNPATNAELFDRLAKHFVDSGFDMKDLIRTFCNSQTYQLTSIPNEHNAGDTQNYSRYYPKRLPAEVLLDAINQVTHTDTKFAGLPSGTRAVQLPDNSFNAGSYMLQVFGRPDMKSSCECERTQDASLAQSLHLINSKNILSKLTTDGSRAAMVALAKERSDKDKIRELYMRAFSRQPDDEEMTIAKNYIDKKRPETKDKEKPEAGQRRAYEDILWALLNTKEFLFIH